MWNSVVLHNIKLGLGMFTVHYGHPDTLVTILLMLEMRTLCYLGMFVLLRSVIVGIYAYDAFQIMLFKSCPNTFLKTILLIL